MENHDGFEKHESFWVQRDLEGDNIKLTWNLNKI